MSAVLLDTVVLSFAIKRDTRFAWYRQRLRDCEPCVCFMTIAELFYWAQYRNWGVNKRNLLAAHLKRCLCLDSEPSICLRWAEVSARGRESGRPIGTADAWVAATALEYELPLFTNNARHYQAVEGLVLVSAPAGK